MSDLDTRLAAARARRAAVADAARKREKSTATEDLVAAEELAARNDEAIEKAIVEHGPLGVKIAKVDTRLGVVILQRPHNAAFKAFQDTPDLKMIHFEKLVRPCVIYPESDKVDQIFDELPAVINQCAVVVSELAGHKTRELSGK